MATTANIRKELFDEIEMSSSEKELLDLTKLDDSDLFRTIGIAAKETRDALKPGTEYLNSPNIGDYTAKSALFFRNPTVESMTPAVYRDLPDDPVEAGRIVYGQLEGQLDKVICNTVTNSPRYSYKQEAIRLAAECVTAIEKHYPNVDSRIDKAYVAIHAKEQFNKCTRW